MANEVPPGPAVPERLALYRLLTRMGPARASYTRKFALSAFIGVFVPLAVFILYLMVGHADWSAMYPALAALVLASFAGFLWVIWAVRELLAPVDMTARALRDYIDRRQLPSLPTEFGDRAGRLMEGTQYTILQLHETINRLERVSDTDELSGVYNRRAGERRLLEEVARAERDLQSFQVALLDIRGLKAVNEAFGHSAGDACIGHVAQLLQMNTRRGDWVARWGGDEFVVGLHRNRALKSVIARLLRAIEANPCEIAPGNELALRLSGGVAEYRFGSGSAGLVADLEHALYAARERAARAGGSQVCYRSELEMDPPAARPASPAPTEIAG